MQASALATTALAAKLQAQNATVKVPTCPGEVTQPGPDEFNNGPVVFRQTPIEPMSAEEKAKRWKGAFATGAGPCGIAKEFGESQPFGTDVKEFLDDDDPNSPGKEDLQKLVAEFGGDANALTEYFEMGIGVGSIASNDIPKAITDISQSTNPIQFLGYG